MRPEAHPIRTVLVLLAAVATVVLAATLIVTRPRTAPSEAKPVAAESVFVEAGQDAAARVLVLGDSWTYGAAATRPELGYAHRLASVAGWDMVIDGEPGSGYLKKGWYGTTFGERIAALDPALDPDVVVVQGSINDRRLPATGYREAASDAWDALAATYPEARIVVLGPAPQVLPVEPATARIDRDLADLAAQRGWPYVSPIGENWITDENYLEVIDTSERGANHPSDAGHAYLAEKVAAAVRPYAPPITVEAVDEQPEPLTGE
ncbi:SGNH/GDSL hydrolase family protein [Microbacterium sp. Marseille-Q6965]|uniref:SGNH/GDSL hydrolase family protein n=1 Tax=Microbacterium sp. Marseille-Q6965 TaxID=2965072 RepID=UPI0021B81DF6|nr:SGNH/GDSL hydrolase family protein [Microbacterium sp. Marseille-Q6965]